MMTRRRFLALLGLAPIAGPSAIQAVDIGSAPSTYFMVIPPGHPLITTGWVSGEIGRRESMRFVVSSPLPTGDPAWLTDRTD